MWVELAGATPGDHIQGVDDRDFDPDASYTVLFRLRHPGRALQLDSINTRVNPRLYGYRVKGYTGIGSDSHRYRVIFIRMSGLMVWCRLTVSKTALKAPIMSAISA
jgi:hypothetical protein